MARSGKDTFAEYLNDFVPTLKYSSIDKVKDIAKQCGWDGTKNEKSRKFLSDLKILTSKFNNMPFRAIKTTVDQFKEDKEKKILLIDIREPKEIEKAKKAGVLISYDPNWREALWKGKKDAFEKIKSLFNYADIVRNTINALKVDEEYRSPMHYKENSMIYYIHSNYITYICILLFIITCIVCKYNIQQIN